MQRYLSVRISTNCQSIHPQLWFSRQLALGSAGNSNNCHKVQKDKPSTGLHSAIFLSALKQEPCGRWEQAQEESHFLSKYLRLMNEVSKWNTIEKKGETRWELKRDCKMLYKKLVENYSDGTSFPPFLYACSPCCCYAQAQLRPILYTDMHIYVHIHTTYTFKREKLFSCLNLRDTQFEMFWGNVILKAWH